MRHIFIVNPMAGKKRRGDDIQTKLHASSERTGIPIEIYETPKSGDGEEYVRAICRDKADQEVIRFYACGGDGALNEIVNGAYGFSNVEVGCIPLGTGNDYVRNYGEVEDFLDIDSQLRSRPIYSDVIMYTINGQTRYCANMFNIGFDCNVVDQTSRTKRWPLVSGPFAYLLSVAIILIKKKGADLRIEYEDGRIFDGKMLLIAVANGCYCGGGVKSNPLAQLNDGLFDICLVKNISRLQFVRLFPKYAKGQHLVNKNLKSVIEYTQCKRLTITPNRKEMRLCTDGEITSAGKTELALAPKGIQFAVPVKS